VVTPVVMPQAGLEVTEGTVTAVHVAVGDAVSEGDPLLEVETDKALSDVVAPRDGVVVALDAQVGDTLPVGAVLVRLADGAGEAPAADPAEGAAADPAEGAAADPAEAAAAAAAAAPATAVQARRGTGSAAPPASAGPNGRLRAAPVARRAAARHGIALETVRGTGPRGRITLADVERAVGQARAAAGAVERMSPTRRVIARRMTASQAIPQYSLDRDVDATWLLAEKERLAAASPVAPGVNDLLLQALAETVRRHPALAEQFVEPDGVRRRDGAAIGLAVATDRGLLVPVIRAVHRRTLAELVAERRRLVEAARAGRLAREEMEGATITLSSLASFGVDRFAAMLNPGEAAILAVGRTTDRVVPRGRGLAVVPAMTLTLTLDHRVVDGAVGAAALADLAALLEGEMTWRT
jgi:pyruvate dehydrogenase E2 component (dihydrolipoamide acetyltransferase)